MEKDYRITKFHGTLIGDNRIPELPDGETAKILSSANGKTAWVDLPTDVGKDANGFAVLCHDGVEITGQRKSVKLADVRDNGAIIGRDQTTSAPQTNELITKAYADKSYEGKIKVINAVLTENEDLTEITVKLDAKPSGEMFILSPVGSDFDNVLMVLQHGGYYIGFWCIADDMVVYQVNLDGTGRAFYSASSFLFQATRETNGKFLSIVNGVPTWSDIPESGSSVTIRRW